MFFEDWQKLIYIPQTCPGYSYDPLVLDRELTKASAGNLNDLLKQWEADETQGDVSAEGKRAARVSKAEAEGMLVAITRKVFELPIFPNMTDAEVLEILCDYLWWMEKKGRRGETPQTSQPSSESPRLAS